MATLREFVKLMDAALKDTPSEHPYVAHYWNEIKTKIDEEFPELTNVIIGRVYKFQAKGGRIARGVCTKENQKTFVLYETTDSGRPGCRWMIGKGWCTPENIWDDHSHDWAIPSHVVVK